MANFATKPRKAQHALNTTSMPTITHEGAPAYKTDAKTELYTLAVTNMMSGNTFYEQGDQRDARMTALVKQVSQEDPAWLQRFVAWLRSEANMRSASVAIAADGVAAGGIGRAEARAAMQRADEPAEMLAYCRAVLGYIPKAVQRAVADVVPELYSEYTVLKYFRTGAWDMADVLQLAHPKPRDENQAALFKYILQRKYDGVGTVDERLPMLQANAELASITDEAQKRAYVLGNQDIFKQAGWTWERLAGWTKLDAAAWETIIPQMGYMALLRNLRNFSEAGIGKDSVNFVKRVLADPERVAKSRQFPYRFYSAYLANKDNFAWLETIEAALELSLANIPKFDGDTLVLVDTSGSMQGGFGQSKATPAQIAGLFGAALAKRNNADLVAFATTAKPVPHSKAQATLRIAENIGRTSVGWGTDVNAGLAHLKGHKRVVILSDMQVASSPRGKLASYGGYVYSFDLMGYGRQPIATEGRRFLLGGFSDAAFKAMPMLESQTWPF